MIKQTREDEWGRTEQSGNKVVDDPVTKLHNRLAKILEMKKRAPTEAEAQSAAELLQRFLTEHNLSIADLEKRGAQSAPGMEKKAHDLGKAAFKWKLDLAEGIATFYYCAPLVDRTTKTVAFVGRPDNVESLTALYHWVIEQIRAIATEERRKHYDQTKEHIDPLRWQLGFGEGAVERLVERLREMKARQEEDASRNEMGDITALARHHLSEVSDWLEEQGLKRMDGRKTKREMESDARWERYMEKIAAERAAKDELRIQCEEAGDMAPYYEAYPSEHPDRIKEREALDAKREREYEKREARNAARRKGSFRSGPRTDWDKLDQQQSARESGRAAAGRVNLQPFVGDGGSGGKTKGKIGG